MSKDSGDDNSNNRSDNKPTHSNKGFESLPRSTIQEIQHADALAIWG